MFDWLYICVSPKAHCPGELLEINRKQEKYPKPNFMKEELFYSSDVNSRSYCCQMPNDYLLCLNGMCVLENGNYSEPRPEVESRSK